MQQIQLYVIRGARIANMVPQNATQFDGQILSQHAKGMSISDIVSTFEEMHDGVQISPMLVSNGYPSGNRTA